MIEIFALVVLAVLHHTSKEPYVIQGLNTAYKKKQTIQIIIIK